MAKFRKRPVTVSAELWDGSNAASLLIREWVDRYVVSVIDTDHIEHLWNYTAGCYVLPSGKVVFAPYQTRCLIILTMEGEMLALPGDYIIQGVQNEFYPCKPDIFAATYEIETETV